MTSLDSRAALRLPLPFANYHLDAAYDEMFDREGTPRASYLALYQRLLDLPAEELRRPSSRCRWLTTLSRCSSNNSSESARLARL